MRGKQRLRFPSLCHASQARRASRHEVPVSLPAGNGLSARMLSPPRLPHETWNDFNAIMRVSASSEAGEADVVVASQVGALYQIGTWLWCDRESCLERHPHKIGETEPCVF